MKEYKFFISFDKEEQWLQQMAAHGYELISKGHVSYKFRPSSPEKVIIKMDYRKFKKARDFDDYCALFEDSGWQHVAGTMHSGYQYFRKTSAEGTDDIFSDSNSKAGRYKRLSQMWISVAICLLPIFAALSANGMINVAAFVNPKTLYYTPGLWDKSGVDFWRAFLFETPFAMARGFLWILIPIMIVLYFLFGLKAELAYKRTQEKQ